MKTEPLKTLLFLICMVLLACPPSYSQEDEIRLIIRSDDMGFSHAGNQAIIDTYKRGITTSVEVMVPTPWFPEAIELLRAHPELDVGVHLVLTSEWSNVKWRPLTAAPSITDESGYFFPMIWPNENYGPSEALKEQNWDIKEIEQEFRAQIELAKRLLPDITHLSGHMGCSQLSGEVSELYKRLAREYDLAIFPEEHGVKYAPYEGEIHSPKDKKQGFLRMIDNLTPGTWLFVDHPAYDTEETRAIHHIGYEDVAADRQAVTDLLTDSEIMDLIKARKIKLISYKDLIGG
jgi:chitin disaccharide deacetylase